MSAVNDNACNDINTPAWVYGPAGEWAPTKFQIVQAISYACGYYGSGSSDEDYSFSQFVQDIENQNDDSLMSLNDAMLREIHQYGEHSNWEEAMSVSGFSVWRKWFYRNNRIATPILMTP
jgi:hypothetical protein